jgi:hypothetical protein
VFLLGKQVSGRGLSIRANLSNQASNSDLMFLRGRKLAVTALPFRIVCHGSSIVTQKDRSRLDDDKGAPWPGSGPFAAHQTPPDLSPLLQARIWVSPHCLGNFAPVPSAHSRYPQYFGCGQVLHISDHLISVLV